MNPFFLPQMAEDHYRELRQTAQAAHAVAGCPPVGRWRQAVGRALVTLGVGVGSPRPCRPGALVEARALLADVAGCEAR